MTDTFSRFPEATLEFLGGIEAHNSKDWFEANRALYEAGYVEPGRHFVETMGPRLKAISQSVRYEPKINGSIGRINRDVRFSRDKRPYKDHLDIWFWHGEKKGWDRPGFYLRITPQTIFLGAGMHTLEGAMLETYRDAATADAPGRTLDKAVAKVKASGAYQIGGATRKSVPRGRDPKHPRAGYLLHEGLYAGIELPARKSVEPNFVDQALHHFTNCWPVGQWLLDEVATR